MRWVRSSVSPAGLLSGLAGALLAALVATPAAAQPILELDVYKNTATNLNAIADIYGETGDEITPLPPASGQWTVTEFEVGYVGFFFEDGDEAMVVRFYANDGPGGEPGTLIYQSAPEPIVSPDSYGTPNTLVLMGLSEAVPLSFTWTVDTVGLSKAPGDVASVISYGPPTIGSSDETEFWGFAFGAWSTGNVFNMSNFYARVRALPEPGGIASALPGVLLLAALARRRATHSLPRNLRPEADGGRRS